MGAAHAGAAFLAAALSLVLGTLGISRKWELPGLPHFFFGVIVLAVVLFLLALPIAWESLPEKWRRGCWETRSEEGTHEQMLIDPPPWEIPALAVCRELGTHPKRGLSPQEADERLTGGGPNKVAEPEGPSFLAFLIKELYEPTQLMLVGVGVLYAMFGGWGEAATALAAILLMILAEVGTEFRSKRALASLQLATPKDAYVVRGGAPQQIPRRQVAVGDLVLLRPGMV